MNKKRGRHLSSGKVPGSRIKPSRYGNGKSLSPTRHNGKKGLEELPAKAAQIRARIVEACHRAKSAHLGGCLSCVDILVAAYWGSPLKITPETVEQPERDRLILSKGHAALALYATLLERGILSEKTFSRFGMESSSLGEQPSPYCAPGVELATGSLGHGLPVGSGLALAARLHRWKNRVLVVMSDGECQEGSVWEAAMFASRKQLSNLAVIIDYNKWQATGRSEEIMSLKPLAAKWKAFGWRTAEVNGHSIPQLITALRKWSEKSTQPLAIIANTVKGRGVSFMEDDNNWHYRCPTEEEVQIAKKELGVL